MKSFFLFTTFFLWISLGLFYFCFPNQKMHAIHLQKISTNKLQGKRLKISGYFNGQEEETISESYISLKTGKETFKVQDLNNKANNLRLIRLSNPSTRLYSSLGKRKYYALSNSPFQAGLTLLENCGDINDDGVDEIGYMINWLDDSQLNTYHILKFDDNVYQEILSFQVHETLSFDPERLFNNGKVFEKLTDKSICYLEYGNDGEFHKREHSFKNKQ
ncbi:hypothetical protein [Pedobacter boryungensis]|uniref:VCBS repeat-containing protein n=1 Tax=Pedobacter boryungensis TaxID=869962 RepID=A0ABX2DGF8_9SPHI|nr:hypothetical protein [Pedobacter boryungensis]NQX33155.1 hypothetical protein [Pedobacter boryungensis]